MKQDYEAEQVIERHKRSIVKTVSRFMDDKRHILMLADQYEFSTELPNLGDRALQAGIRHLIECNSHASIASAQWKVFPYYNSNTYAEIKAKGKDPMNVWYHQVLLQVSVTSRYANFSFKILNQLKRSYIFKPLDRWSRLHTGQGFISAIETRLFRSYHVDRLIKQLVKSDLVIFNGGELLADHLEFYLPGRLFELYLAKKLGCKLVAVNYSVALNIAENIAMAAPILASVDYHLVREPFSQYLLESYGVPSDSIGITYDAAFAVPDIEVQKQETTIDAIGIMIRGDRPIDFDAWAILIKNIQDQYGVDVYYLQTCRKYDQVVRRELEKRCQLAGDSCFQDYPQLINTITQMRLLITDRYYGMIFSVLAGTPFVPVQSTTHKMMGFLKLHKYELDLLPILSKDKIDDFLLTIDHVLSKQNELNRDYQQEISDVKRILKHDYQQLLARFEVGI